MLCLFNCVAGEILNVHRYTSAPLHLVHVLCVYPKIPYVITHACTRSTDQHKRQKKLVQAQSEHQAEDMSMYAYFIAVLSVSYKASFPRKSTAKLCKSQYFYFKKEKTSIAGVAWPGRASSS